METLFVVLKNIYKLKKNLVIKGSVSYSKIPTRFLLTKKSYFQIKKNKDHRKINRFHLKSKIKNIHKLKNCTIKSFTKDLI